MGKSRGGFGWRFCLMRWAVRPIGHRFLRNTIASFLYLGCWAVKRDGKRALGFCIVFGTWRSAVAASVLVTVRKGKLCCSGGGVHKMYS